MRTSGQPVLVQIATFYTELVRGIPILVFLFYVAFVGAPATIVAANWLTAAAAVARLDAAAHRAQFRSHLARHHRADHLLLGLPRRNLPRRHRGGARAARSKRRARSASARGQIIRHIVAPQAFRIILPPLGNDFVSMIKDSALVSSLGVQDITQLGKVYSAATFKFFETYNVVAFLYLTMTISLSLLVRFIEHRLKRQT